MNNNLLVNTTIEQENRSNLDVGQEVVDNDSVLRHFQPDTLPLVSSMTSTSTVTPHLFNLSAVNDIQVPIVGYEVMEERARFTVYKLRVEQKLNGGSWVVYRRYTDFVRLCNSLKPHYPHIAALLPRKRYFGNNFDPLFLEERIKKLQQFIDALLLVDDLLKNTNVQDFLCLNESPLDNEQFVDDSRVICDALSETIYQLRNQLKERDMKIVELNEKLCEQQLLIEHCKEFFGDNSLQCSTCSEMLNRNQHLNKLINNSEDNQHLNNFINNSEDHTS